jgi:hypothetical protein
MSAFLKHVYLIFLHISILPCSRASFMLVFIRILEWMEGMESINEEVFSGHKYVDWRPLNNKDIYLSTWGTSPRNKSKQSNQRVWRLLVRHRTAHTVRSYDPPPPLSLQIFSPLQTDPRSDICGHESTQKTHLRKGSRGGTSRRAPTLASTWIITGLGIISITTTQHLHDLHDQHRFFIHLVVFPIHVCGSAEVFIHSYIPYSPYHYGDVVSLNEWVVSLVLGEREKP